MTNDKPATDEAVEVTQTDRRGYGGADYTMRQARHVLNIILTQGPDQPPRHRWKSLHDIAVQMQARLSAQIDAMGQEGLDEQVRRIMNDNAEYTNGVDRGQVRFGYAAVKSMIEAAIAETQDRHRARVSNGREAAAQAIADRLYPNGDKAANSRNYIAFNAALATLATLSPDDKLRGAAEDLLAGAASTYTARNGREVGIEADDGEKCYIVHSDLITGLRAALGDTA